ncbi:MAG: superoxide dismutase family protein [Eubacterium sp.]|nr:superoxide dismutase family protein [Eubacterium sp.]
MQLCRRPDAEAVIIGSEKYPLLCGVLRFYRTGGGVLCAAEISGLPDKDTPCRSGVFGFHIHGGECCSGNADDPFADAEMHYNPENYPHPYHAGDMPPLFSNCGYAFSVFLTDRFSLRDVIGKTVIIHSKPDDFTTQPSGNSGEKIACGRITGYCR